MLHTRVQLLTVTLCLCAARVLCRRCPLPRSVSVFAVSLKEAPTYLCDLCHRIPGFRGERERASELTGADQDAARGILPRRMCAFSPVLARGVLAVIGPGLHPESLGTIYSWSFAKVQMVQSHLEREQAFPLENAAWANTLIFQQPLLQWKRLTW